MGFCYLNNIAVAALEASATGTKRVAVFDFDVHHGNGTEDILLNHEGTAFFSIHQFPAYPGSGKGNVEYWVARVLPGKVLFEIEGMSEAIAREAFRLASAKLSVSTAFVKRQVRT